MIAQLIQKALFPIFLLSILLLPLSIETNLGFLPAQLIFLIEPLAIISCCLLIILSILNFKNIKLSLLDKLVILYVIANLLSTLFSENQTISLKYNITIIWYILIGYTLPQWLYFKKHIIQKSTFAFIIGTSLLVIFVIFQITQFGIFFESSYKISNPFIPQGHTNLSVVIEPALICLLLLSIFTKKKIFQMGFVIFLGIIMYSCSRASYISLGLMFFVGLFLFKKAHRLEFIKIGIIGFSICLSFWYLNDYIHFLKYNDQHKKTEFYNSEDISTYKQTSMIQELGKMDEYKKDESNNERVERWKAGISFWQSNIFTGIGIGTYPDKYLKFIRTTHEKLNKLQARRMNIHNLYLSWLVEGGILLFLSGVSILLFLVLKMKTYIFSKKYSVIKIGICLFFISFLFHGLGQDFSQDPRIIIPFWLVVSLFSSKTQKSLPK